MNADLAPSPQSDFNAQAAALPAGVQGDFAKRAVRAAKAAQAYNGSEKTLNAALAALGAIEAVRNLYFPNLTSHNDRMSAEAALVKAFSPSAAFNHTDDLLSLMEVAAKENRRAANGDYSKIGIHTVRVAKPLAMPGPAPRLPQQNTKGGPAYQKAQPNERLEEVLGILNRNGISNDQLVLFEGPPPEGTLREQAYMVLAIPHRGVELGICNEEKQAVLAASPPLGPSAWETLRKSELYENYNVRAIHHSAHFEAEVMAFVNTGIGGRAVSPRSYAAAPPLSVAALDGLIIEHIRQTGRVPNAETKSIVGGRETGLALRKAIHSRHRGLHVAPIPKEVNTLATYLDWRWRQGVYQAVLAEKGLSARAAGFDVDYTIDEINRWVCTHILAEKKAPVQKPSQIIGAEDGITWQNLQSSLHQGWNGLDKLLPYKRMGLSSYIGWQCAEGAFDEVLAQAGVSWLEAGIDKPVTLAEVYGWVRPIVISPDRSLRLPTRGSAQIEGAPQGMTGGVLQGRVARQSLGFNKILPPEVTAVIRLWRYMEKQGYFREDLLAAGKTFTDILPKIGAPKKKPAARPS